MTIPGIDMVVARALMAAIGDIECFAKPKQLVGYLGLNPSVRQSGPGPAYRGRITKPACWSRRAGPQRAVRARARCAVSFFARATRRRRRDGAQARHSDLASDD